MFKSERSQYVPRTPWFEKSDNEKNGGERGKEKGKGGGGGGRQPKSLGRQDICVGEELKIAVSVAVDRFRNDENEKELEIPSSLTANERAYVHRYCQDLGLISKSRGKGNKRFLTIYKVKEESVSVQSRFTMTKGSSNLINSLLNSFPVTSRDKHELSGQKLHKGIISEQNKILARENRLVLGNGPHVPPEARETEIGKAAEGLPIFEFKDEILKAIDENQVTFIAGDTGSGKTTQVGQFLLQQHHSTKTPCRIVCTQPRRLSAISVSERVSAERGERIGQTIGYQVRLDSKLSPKTLLHFCTNGVLLRLLMVGHKCLSNITHVIVDEIHERDRFSDYLLISLRDILKTYKNLKVILMSAALNVDLFKTYFGNSCPFIQVSGSCYPVKTYFLEDVLKQTGYLNGTMRKLLQDSDSALFAPTATTSSGETRDPAADIMKIVEKSGESSVMEDKESDVEIESDSDADTGEKKTIQSEENEAAEAEEKPDVTDLEEKPELKELDVVDSLVGGIDTLDISTPDSIEDVEEQEEEEDKAMVSEEMDSFLAQAWLNGDDEAFEQIIHLIMNEHMDIDYQHSETQMTALIVSAARGNLTLVEQLIELGSNLDIEDPKNNRNALEWARHFNQNHVADYIQSIVTSREQESLDKVVADDGTDEIDDNDRRRLELYHKSFDDQRVDISLIMALLSCICKKATSLEGSILIFLPGYDEIMQLRDKLMDDKEFSKRSKYQILLLHSMIPPSNQRKVFGTPPQGCRKIILSTNLAETSVTIEDVVYVIDSGKVKEKSHDSVSSVSMLRSVWVSKASAVQRRGRAGRCAAGICYHLFSQDRFHHLQMYQDAEILRVPIHELCLQTKMLAPANVSICDYLSKAPEAPSNLMVRNSIRMLKAISALDENEDMTDLGKLLVEIPVDPQLGKMILVGMTLKCLEPAIIIACCSAYKEPFLLPTVASQRSAAATTKLKLSAESYSDHIAMLRAFQGWQRAKREGREKTFCHKNFISPGTMEMIFGMRRQILMHLRGLGLVRPRPPGDIKDLNTNSRNWAVIKAVVAAGLYPNFIKVDRDNLVLVSEKEKKVNIHNSSVLMAKNEDKVQSTVSRANKMKLSISNLPFDWLAYEELSRLYYSVQIRFISVLSPVATALIGGSSLSYEHSSLRLRSNRDKKGKKQDKSKDTLFQESDSEQEGEDSVGSFKVDEWISFTAEDPVLYAIAMLRIKFLALFSKRIQIPAKPWTQADDAIVQCIANILTKEEQAVGLTNPATKDIEKRLSFEKRNDRFGNRYDTQPDGPRVTYTRTDRTLYSRKQGADGRRKLSGEGGGTSDGKSNGDSLTNKEVKRRARSYFIMKCNNEKNLPISFERNIWATTKSNEKRLNRAFNISDEVFLIFSIQGSGHFQGVAKMVSAISDKFCDDFGSANLGGVFDVEWLYKEEIPFQFTQHLTNPWNDNKKVQISRDAQEVEPVVGADLVLLWENVNETSKETSGLISPDGSTVPEEVSEFYPDEVYAESEGTDYMEGYPVYSPPSYNPPSFNPSFVPDFQHCPPHYAPGPPHMTSPHMTYQQSYPMYAPPGELSPYRHQTGGMSPYRHQEYYSLPQYTPPKRTLHDVFHRDAPPFTPSHPDAAPFTPSSSRGGGGDGDSCSDVSSYRS